MGCQTTKPLQVPETHSHFGNPFLQKSFRLLGNRLWHVICAHNRYGEWMIGEASGIVGRFESRLRQQRNHTIFPAFGSPLDFHYQLLAGARSNQIGGGSALARLLDYFPAFLAKEIGYDQPELGFVVWRRVWIMAWHRLTTAMVFIMATLIIMAMIYASSSVVKIKNVFGYRSSS